MTRQFEIPTRMTRFLLVTLVLVFAAVAAVARGSAPDGAADDITVHGHWTVEVLWPDGSLAGLYEFDNALSSNGNLTLPQVLAGEWSAERWAIEAHGTPSDPCDDGSGSPAPCLVWQGEPPSPNQFGGLEVASQGSVGDASLLLAGDVVVSNDTDLDFVATRLQKCLGGDCAVDSQAPTFTEKALATPIAVTSGQTVRIEVEISFG